MKRSNFCPDSYTPDPTLKQWARDTFNISNEEIARQLELMKDHEFIRKYSCWNRVFRNWLRKAEDIGSLRRERKYRKPEQLTEEQRSADILKFQEHMERLGVK